MKGRAALGLLLAAVVLLAVAPAALGRVIVGYGQTASRQFEAWRAVLPVPR
jgi:hypothetical protein